MKKLVIVLVSMVALVASAAPIFAADRSDELKRPDQGVLKPEAKPKTAVTSQSATVAPGYSEPITSAATATDTRAGEQVTWQVIASGGGVQSLGSMTLGSTVGQTAAGWSSLGSYQINSGFWQNWTTPESCCIERGDVNREGDGFDISDIVYFVNWMFLDGPVPPCMEEADANASGGDADISDLVYFVAYMFQEGPAPIPCP